ncbi:MAG: hypothetical protein IJ783_06935 [Kiritimatiellae bacterium]|nr:hypothetical protein [Kiritimatiellia bacterium]
MGGTLDLWEPLVPQITDAAPDAAIRAFRWIEPGKELGFVSTWFSSISDPSAEPVPAGLYPIANHFGEPNSVVTAWEWFPYLGNDGGEARIRLQDGRPFRALVPLFAGDRQTIERGVPRPCWFSAIGIDLVPVPSDCHPGDIPETVAARRAARGAPVSDFIVEPGDLESGPLCYFRGRVADVRTVGLSGCSDVLRVDLEVGLPFALPVYARQREKGEAGFVAGGFAGGFTIPLVDFFDAAEDIDAWFASHPHGAGSEPRWSEPGCRKAVRRHAKRPAQHPDRDLRPEDFRISALAADWLDDRYGAGNVVRWDANPTGATFAVRLPDGTVRRYCAHRCVGDEPHGGFLPCDCGCVAVRFRDAGDSWSIDYEEILPHGGGG